MRATHSLFFVATATRRAPKYPRPRPGTAERPPYRAGDPLANNPKAKVTTLVKETAQESPVELTFIHRPPPSAPSPFSLTTAPASPLLVPKTSNPAVPLPPLVRPSASTQDASEPPRMSDEDMAKLRELRRSDPFKYSRSKLAEMFSCTTTFVGMVAPLKKSQCKTAHTVLNEKHERAREGWSEKHSIVQAIRKKRKELW